MVVWRRSGLRWAGSCAWCLRRIVRNRVAGLWNADTPSPTVACLL